MGRYFIFALGVIAFALIDSALMPFAFSASARPSLLIVITAIWAIVRGDEGILFAFLGGFLFDFFSQAPIGLTSLSLMVGHGIGLLLDQAPLPSVFWRAIIRVIAVSTVQLSILLGATNLLGKPIDPTLATTSILLPSVLLDAVFAVPISVLLIALNRRLTPRRF
jgi:rod shape-determining protein MreD